VSATATSQSTDPVWKTALVQDFGSANLVVSTKFMEAYELVRSVSGGADLTTFLNREGNLDVYSVGTANHVSRIRQQNDSADGWVEDDLGIVARQISAYIATGGDSNNPNLLGLNDQNQLTLSTWDQGLKRYTQRVFQPSGATKKIKQFLATKNFDNVYVNVILEDDVVGTNFIKPDGTWASRDWVPIKQGQGSAQDAKASFITMCSNNPVQTALYAIALDGEILFAESSSRFSYFTKIGYIKGSDLAVVQDTMNRLNILALDPSGKLWWKRQKKYQSGQSLEWDDWKQVDKDNTTQLVSIDAVINAAGMVEVFGIGADDLLYHTRQVGTPDVPVWGTLFPLGNPVPNSIMTVGRSAAGYSEVYTVTHDNQLYRFWQDPMTTQWYNAEIGLQQSAEMVPVPAHSAEILVIDYEGLAQPEADVRIKASTLTSLNINGKYYIASQYRTVTVKSNTSGIVNLFLSTQSLTAPTLFISTNFTNEAEGVEVQPNAQLQKQLYGVTTQQVMDAKTVSGEYLLKGADRTPENAATLAQVSNKAMSLGGPPPVPSSLRMRPVGAQRRAHLVRTGGGNQRPGSGWRIDHSQVEEQHWSVDFRSGFPRYRDLTREEATQRLAFIDSAKATATDTGFLGVDWGDIWNSIKKGVTRILGALQEFFVSTIVDPITGLVNKIRVAFEFIVDGVTQFFDTVIEFFQQAFDIVEGIWNKIKVFFQELWEWLAFLFNWDDMQRTAAAIEHTMTQSLDYMVLGVRSVRGLVETGFDSMSDQIKQAVDAYLATIDGQTDLGQYTDENNEPQPALDSSVGHNVLQNSFEANYSETVSQESKALIGVNAGVDRIVEEIEALVNNFQFGDGKAVFDEAVGYFNQIGSDPDNALKLVMAGTIKIMEGVALFTIAAAKGTVLTILDLVIDVVEAVKAMLTEEWEIPFVSQLYKLITGKSLTFRPAQIFSLILAVPSTILYKIMTGSAPFPDDAALARFTDQYTALWLAEQSGISPASKRAAMTAQQAAAMEEWRKWVSGIFGCLFATVFVLKIWLDSTIAAVRLVIDTLGPSVLNGKRVRILGIVGIASNLLPILFTTPWIIRPNAGGFGCDGPGLANLRWLLNACLGAGVGAIFVLARVPGVVGDLWTTLWGAANLALVITVAAKGGTDALVTTWAVFTTLAPQLFRILQPIQIWGDLVIFTVPGLMVTYVLTYPVIAGLWLGITFRSVLAEANARILGRRPAEDTLDEPVAAWQPVLAGGTPLQPGLA